jgi:hypothetical protein
MPFKKGNMSTMAFQRSVSRGLFQGANTFSTRSKKRMPYDPNNKNHLRDNNKVKQVGQYS